MVTTESFRRLFRPFKVHREAVDSARAELDSISIPSYERVITELDRLESDMRMQRGAQRSSTLKRIK